MIEVDGSHGEGGGQIYRMALAIAALKGEDVRITNIRAGRPKPGLSRQHMTAAKAIASMTDGRVKGLRLGSPEVIFRPGPLKGGSISLDVGTAGSVTLVLQACLLPAILAGAPTEFRIRGGTDVKWSPPADYFIHVFLPQLRRMGIHAEMSILKRGYYPRGGGLVEMRVEPCPSIRALRLPSLGETYSIGGKFYRYAITDSLTITVPGRTVRAVGVRVEPKVLGPSLIAGNVWFDADTYEVVRLTFVFVGQYTWVSPDGSSAEDSAGARRENVWAQRIARLEADLEYALYERVYWMPYRQLLQITVEIPWFLNLKVPIRFITTFSEYEVNQSVLPVFEVALDSVLEEAAVGERWRRRRGMRCPEGARSAVRCNSETGYVHAGPRPQGGQWEIHYPPRDSLF
ncbi:MAG: RNA 3'-terminal phosphate cyclase, partial [Thermoplasmata archaeon]